jgi:hypothetical protein
MSTNFTKRTLPRRIVALAAAYAIALSGLIASFGAAQAAATALPAGFICHTAVTDQQAPPPSDTNGKLCVNACCIGCLMMTAALPPPPGDATPIARTVSYRVDPLAAASLGNPFDIKSHRSRAPPQTA